MGADPSLFFEAGEIASDAGCRRTYLVHMFLNRNVSRPQDDLHNAIGAGLRSARHGNSLLIYELKAATTAIPRNATGLAVVTNCRVLSLINLVCA
jgi:hypothetical protein